MQRQLTANVLARQAPLLAALAGALALVVGGAGLLAWRWRRRGRGGA
jgi:LPXTG-motif cell wall-anchored protein